MHIFGRKLTTAISQMYSPFKARSPGRSLNNFTPGFLPRKKPRSRNDPPPISWRSSFTLAPGQCAGGAPLAALAALLTCENIDLLNQAVARDPAFHLAWCELAAAHAEHYFQNYDHTPARLALADAAIEGVRRLQPDSAETHLAAAWYLYYGYLDYDRARAELAIAQRTRPNDPSISEILAKSTGVRDAGKNRCAISSERSSWTPKRPHPSPNGGFL